jgi:glycosyltransferase involved in cell wall biosynthesis
MKIAIVTDAWLPQINGVVRTMRTTIEILQRQGHVIKVIGPNEFRNVPLPSYPEIRIALLPGRRLAQQLREFEADAIHISTEGSLGHAARHYCLKNRLRFTTAYHTRFPEYVRLRVPVPLTWSYAFVRRFHRPSSAVMVATESLQAELETRGFENIRRWSRGVDIDLFKPYPKLDLAGPRPIFLYVGRVAVEKNIRAFLSLDLPGSKYVIGDGPAMSDLKRRYPEVVFLGYKTGRDLAEHISSADVMVFPSLTDTFGLVVLEAIACGVPVAAYPVTGPRDIVINGINGWLDDDLGRAARRALDVPAQRCREFAEGYSWEKAASQFVSNLVPVDYRDDMLQSADIDNVIAAEDKLT